MGGLGIELKNLVSVYEKVTLFCRSKHNNFLFKHDESLERFRLVAWESRAPLRNGKRTTANQKQGRRV